MNLPTFSEFSMSVGLVLWSVALKGSTPAQTLATTASTHPASAIRGGSTAKRVPSPKHGAPSRTELYSLFLKYVHHVQVTADTDQQLGRNSSDFRSHTQRASGLTESEYDFVLQAATRYAVADDALREQAKQTARVIKGARDSQKRIPKSLILGQRAYISSALRERAEVLQKELALLSQELGKEREAALWSYLQHGYLQRSIGNVPEAVDKSVKRVKGTLERVSPHAQTKASTETQTTDTTLDSDETCDDSDFSCADAQIAYRGPNGVVDLYANVDYGDSAIILDDEEDIALITITSEGDLSTNGGEPVQYCFEEGSCSSSAPLSTGVDYLWDATSTVYYYYDCDDVDACEDDVSWTAELGVSIAAPDINQLLPNQITPGSTGTITIDGEGLISPFGNWPTVNTTHQATIFSALSVESINIDEGTVTINYTVIASPTTGVQTITLNNGFGSGEDELTVTAASPLISSIVVQGAADDNLDAGSTQTVVLTGTNFGTGTPGISTDVGGSYASVVAGSIRVISAGTSVSFEVSVPVTAPETPVSFQLEAHDGTSNPTADSPLVNVDPVDAPAPVILDGSFAGANNSVCSAADTIANPAGGDNTQNVWVGQMVSFTGCTQVPAGLTIASSTWTVASSPTNNFVNDAVGGLSLGAPEPNPTLGTNVPNKGNYTAVPVTVCNSGVADCDFSTIYPINQGQYNFTYTYVLSNGQTNSATVTYAAFGPVSTGVSNYVPPNLPVSVCGGQQTLCVYANPNPAAAIVLKGNGFILHQSGIDFTIAAAVPAGLPIAYPINLASFLWIQLLAPRSIEVLTPTGIVPYPLGAGLDNTYPYPLDADSAAGFRYSYDAPGLGLNPAYAEVNDQFAATMYLMWDPSLGASGQVVAGCAASTIWNARGGATSTPSQCSDPVTGTFYSVPVPMGSVSWGYCANAINTATTQQNELGVTTAFTLTCSSLYGATAIAGGGNLQFTPAAGASSFPGWGTVVMNTAAEQE